MARASHISRTTWGDRKPGLGAVAWLLLLVFLSGSGFVVVFDVGRALSESGADLVLTDSRSTVNSSYLQLAAIPYGDRAKIPALQRAVGAGEMVWLLDRDYPNGSYGAGTYTLELQQQMSSCWATLGRCHVTVSFGYCRAACTALSNPIVSFRHPLDRSLAGLQAFQEEQGPAVTLSGCPCHYYLRFDTVAPNGLTWNLAYGRGLYTEIDPANANIAEEPLFLAIAWLVGSIFGTGIFIIVWGVIAGLLRTGQSTVRALPVRRFADANGLTFSVRYDGVDASHAAEMLGLGERFGFENAVHGLWRQLPVVAGDFWYVPHVWFMPSAGPGTIGRTPIARSVDAITTRYRSVAIATTAGRLPFVVIRRGGGGIALDLPGFDNTFQVRSDDVAFARTLIDGRLASWLIQVDPRYEFRLEGDRVLISSPLLRVERIGEMLDTLRAFMDQVPEAVWRTGPAPVSQTGGALRC